MGARSLEQLWSRRDAAYASRRTYGQPSLSEQEVEGVITWRRLEALALPEGERARVLARLSLWSPPPGRS
jgi:hypothetical protein